MSVAQVDFPRKFKLSRLSKEFRSSANGNRGDNKSPRAIKRVDRNSGACKSGAGQCCAQWQYQKPMPMMTIAERSLE